MGLPLQIVLYNLYAKCVCVCTHTLAYMRSVHASAHAVTHAWICACLGGCGPASGISAQDSILLVFETQFFLAGNSQIQLGWAMSRRDPPVSIVPCCGYKCLLLRLSSCMDVRVGLGFSCPHAVHRLICLLTPVLTLLTTCTEFCTV